MVLTRDQAKAVIAATKAAHSIAAKIRLEIECSNDDVVRIAETQDGRISLNRFRRLNGIMRPLVPLEQEFFPDLHTMINAYEVTA